MGNWKLRLYHNLPPVLMNFAASVRGYQLRQWRYGPESERLIHEALERDHWSIGKWKSYQEDRLEYVLHRAATRVPFYRAQWAQRRRNGDRASWNYLENWPILKKDTLRQNIEAFIVDDCNPKTLYVDNTSGTTGTPLKVYVSRSTLRQWYALFEARWRKWYGLSRHENWAILGGQPVIPTHQNKPPFWVWNRSLNQLYLSSNHVSKQNATAFVAALERYKVTHLIAYASSATYLAQQILRLDPTPDFPYLRSILTNAEPLYDWQRELLTGAFKCPVYETYGMGEMVTAASEDSLRRLRVWPEPGYIEVLHDFSEQPVEVGEIGRLICTSFLNVDMPLIRYEVGDRSGFSLEAPLPDDELTNPILLPVQGRNNDMLITKDGRHIFWINPIFYQMPIVEAQVIQNTRDTITVRYVPSSSFSERSRTEIENRLRKRIGEIDIVFEQMERIPRDPNGKFRAVLSKLAADELKKVE